MRNIEKIVEKEAKEYGDQKYWYTSIYERVFSKEEQAARSFESGARYGFKLAVDLLETDEAQTQELVFKKDVEVFGNNKPTNSSWAGWLRRYLW